MTATAVPGRMLVPPKGVVQGPLPTQSRAVVLNFGIIDILQEYNLSKQVEHSWKVSWHRRPLVPPPCVRLAGSRMSAAAEVRLLSAAGGPQSIVQGQQNISSVNPAEYSRRFQDFMGKVFY